MDNSTKQSINFIIDSFKVKDIIIILISCKSNKYYFRINFQIPDDDSYIRNNLINLSDINYQEKLNEKQIKNIFKLLKSEIDKFKKRVILIIFNEYFFSRCPISENKRNKIIDLLSEEVIGNENEILFLLNILYKLNKSLSNEKIEELKVYITDINSDVNLFKSNHSSNKLVDDNINSWITNESILVYKKKIIFSQKKQVYCNEVCQLKNNFSLGFGDKETNLKKNDLEYDLFIYLDSILNIDICLDIQKKYSCQRQKFMTENISYLPHEDQEIINKKRALFKKHITGENYKNKEFYIIQSNTTNINESLNQFPNNKIIIQVDPLSSGIFKTNYTKGFDMKKDEFNYKINKFYENLWNKNKEFIDKENSNREKQEIEFHRTKKNADEVYDILINNLYQSNFYNIIELVNPDNTITYSDNEIKLEILINDLKNKMFDKNI